MFYAVNFIMMPIHLFIYRLARLQTKLLRRVNSSFVVYYTC